ncbi:MAG: replication factor C small subunit [Nanoarchaeota archaeon]|nr:replication factor C small subunit [Nanoarchaeota archaeon]|tara:strand:+ start:61292 stop:62242 length:951 start_codon:yes stop_codon:yes gene_type:complete
MGDSSIWIEKFRPKSFKEVIGQDNIVNRIKAFVEQKNLPHLLFSGPAGVGKTSLILTAARELYGDSWRNNIMETNASDSRGIDTVRKEVKDFARTRAIGDVPFKICILDEADALTREAQQALRRTMEQYSSICRFCLITNWSSKIIDPIQSRCTIFRFKPLDKESVNQIVDNIVKEEKLKLDDKTREALFYVSNGDVRRLENVMQSCSTLSKNINEELVYEIVSSAKPKEIKEVLDLAVNGNFVSAKEKLLDVMLKHGLSGLDIIKQIQGEIWGLELEDERKIELVDKCGEVEFRMIEGSDEFVQLESLIANFMKK